MTNEEAFKEVVGLIAPYAKNQTALDHVELTTNILKDLEVNSARLVDIVLEIEDKFDIEVLDEEADEVVTVGNAVDLILRKVR